MKLFRISFLLFCTAAVLTGCATSAPSDGKSVHKVNGYISTSAGKQF